MPNTRVIYISEITIGSKFRTIGANTAKAAAAKKKGVKWASCIPKDSGGNFSTPFNHDVANPAARAKTIFNPTFGWIKVWPPTFNIFNKPCPWAIGHTFNQQGQKPNYSGFSFFNDALPPADWAYKTGKYVQPKKGQ
jgi:hypothetical protein